MTNMEPNKGEIVMYQPDETIRLEVRMDGETVWLSQAQMAELFKSSRTNVVEHIQHIYEDEELVENLTCRKFRQVRQEGKRMVEREIPMYNLDMIISVGYRVNSKRGVKFRQWATRKVNVWTQARNSSPTSACKRPQQRNCSITSDRTTTGFWPLVSLCRLHPTPSQQLDEDIA